MIIYSNEIAGNSSRFSRKIHFLRNGKYLAAGADTRVMTHKANFPDQIRWNVILLAVWSINFYKSHLVHWIYRMASKQFVSAQFIVIAYLLRLHDVATKVTSLIRNFRLQTEAHVGCNCYWNALMKMENCLCWTYSQCNTMDPL